MSLQQNTDEILLSSLVERSDTFTDIHQRSQMSYTTPCNGVVSHGARFGGPWVFADHARKHKRKSNALTIFVHHTAFYTFYLHAHKDGAGSGISSVYLWIHLHSKTPIPSVTY